METNFFRGKKVTVFGLGLLGGGVGTVKFLIKHGAKVIVTDIKTKEQLKSSMDQLRGFKDIEYVLGHHRIEDFTNVDMVIKNPVVPWSNKHIKLALDKKIPVEMDSSLFFKLCKNPIIGVTGTKGKTTAATMIFDLLKLSGKNPVKVGISRTSVLDKLESLKKESVVVFELSSWRLSALKYAKMSPHIAVFKNIHPDHLNYYKNMDEYIEDKKNIFRFQTPKDWLVANFDDEIVREISKEANSQVIGFSKKPLREGLSVFMDESDIYLNNGIDNKFIVAKEELNIVGEHNLYNVMAAIGAASAYGVNIEKIRKYITSLKGVQDRLEFVREFKGVKYYNDTAATIPQAAISALNSFDENVVLIAGGSDKKLDFSEFAFAIVKKAKGLILLKGDATEKLAKLIKARLSEEGVDDKIEIVSSMDKAVEKASRFSESGDVVLLSPGAASFGMFNNEFDRGEKFKESVKSLR
ncbi:MAG: UDP-N-acetylmuramoyl-L-alanine--D-glutamate ligase [Candidatus Moranbacteria bacterium]|nr:UDP-N-acetylmuramoyl-L-alanine--D-glutamate ligase [Candidatus Moranbacteria bacterium]